MLSLTPGADDRSGHADTVPGCAPRRLVLRVILGLFRVILGPSQPWCGGVVLRHSVKRGVVMSVTDSFGKLGEQVEEANAKIKAAADQGEAVIQAKVDDARRDADHHVAEVGTKSSGGTSDGESNWQQIQADWKRHVGQTRQRVDTAKAAVDADTAVRQAKSAESDALDAIAFAQSAIAEAEGATLDAMQAITNANRVAARAAGSA